MNKTEYLVYFLASLLVFVVSSTQSNVLLILASIPHLNTASTAILGFLGTVLVIIYTFKSSFEENEAVEALDKQDGFKYVLGTLTSSVLVVLWVWIYTLFLAVFPVLDLFGKQHLRVISYLVIFSFTAMVGKVFISIFLFKQLGDALDNNGE